MKKQIPWTAFRNEGDDYWQVGNGESALGQMFTDAQQAGCAAEIMNETGKAKRDLAKSTQRIAELESKLRTQASEHSLANRRLEDEIGRLRHELGFILSELEQAHHADPDLRASIFSELLRRLPGFTAISPSPPAVEKKQSLYEVKAAFAAGKRVQCSAVGEVWRPCVSPPNAWPEKWLYRIHPDDDTPPVPEGCEIVGGSSRMCERGTKACGVKHKPVQTEEKAATVQSRTLEETETARANWQNVANEREEEIDRLTMLGATVPLAVAEKLAEALERQCPVSDSLLRLKDSALAQFNALTK